MEIKKGVSQMAEYPNLEIDYVVPKSGNMYYVLKDGKLSNGALITTIDPRYAIDETNECSTVGVFSENGDILVDFDKSKISKINDDLLLVVNSKPTTDEVLYVLSKHADEKEKSVIEEDIKKIEEKLLEEMGEGGEIIFSDPFKEANVYRTDSYNNKIGLDCSVIGKNNQGLYFHTNVVESETKFVKVDEFATNVGENLETLDDTQNEKSIDDNIEDIPDGDVEEPKLDLGDEGFKISDEELNNISFDEVDNMINNDEKDEEIDATNEESTKEELKQDEIEDEESSQDKYHIEDGIFDKEATNDEVFENAIELINKYMNEANKLNERIKEMEEYQKKQEELIKKQEKELEEQQSKKDELNSILSKANQVLENIK